MHSRRSFARPSLLMLPAQRSRRNASKRPWLSVLHILESTDESPAPAEFPDRHHQFIAPFLERQVNRVVLRIDDTEESRVAEILRAATPEKNPAIQKDADVVAVANVKLFHLITLGFDDRACIHDLHSWLRLQSFG